MLSYYLQVPGLQNLFWITARTFFFFAFLLAQPADFFRDDNPEGIEARTEVSKPY